MEETQSPAKKRSLRPPLWVMSVLVAAAVLFYLVENRPVAKHVVSAKPAAATESTTQPPATHKPTAKGTKPPVTAQQPGTTVGAAAIPTYPHYSIAPATVPGVDPTVSDPTVSDPTGTVPPSVIVAPAAPAPAVPASPAFAG